IDKVVSGQSFSINGEYATENDQEIDNPYVSFNIRDAQGTLITDLWNQGAGYLWEKLPGKGIIRCTINKCPLNEGTYFYSIYCKTGDLLLDRVIDAGKINVEKGDYFGSGKLPNTQFSKILVDQNWELIKS
ncbi:MAG: Wzt carbohydrate-binding domain-containing protein, partial [Syntrophaceae bacterium]|nr:Wzt carbohydrate-binding domain-containing protein [Syntrophaceae bacterium]